MTVDAQSVVEGPFTPNGATTVWPFTFTAQDPDEVSLVRVSPQGGVTEIDGGVDLDDGGGGTVTVSPALSAGSGDLYILLVPSFAQTTVFEAQGAFSPTAMNAALDRAAARDQYLKALLDRAVLAPLGSAGLDASGIIAAIDGARDAALQDVDDAVSAEVAAYINLHARTRAWISAVDAAGDPPTIERALLMDRTMRELVRLDAFAWTAGIFVVGETQAMSLVNLVDPALAATVQGGTLGFLADRHLQSDGAAYVDTGVNLTASSRFAQDKAFLLVSAVSNVLDGANRLAGSFGGRAYVAPSTTTNHIRVQANSAIQCDSVASTTSGYGVCGWARRSSSAFDVWFDRAVLETIANDSAAIMANTHMQLLKAGSQVATGKLGWAAFGGGAAMPTDNQLAGLVEAMERHLAEIGGKL